LKCDKKESYRVELFEPESPYVIVCEGFQDVGLMCALLTHLRINNCDVTYPKRSEGGNGKEAIRASISLLAGRPEVQGILVIADSDENQAQAFADVCTGLKRFPVPPRAFTTVKRSAGRTGVFLLPGEGKTGALEHLLLEVVRDTQPEIITHVETYRNSTAGTKQWSDNKNAKMKMQCIVAATCRKNPYCSLAWVWEHDSIPLRIDSPVLKELSDLLVDFVS
jgi:hypothetical protein